MICWITTYHQLLISSNRISTYLMADMAQLDTSQQRLQPERLEFTHNAGGGKDLAVKKQAILEDTQGRLTQRSCHSSSQRWQGDYHRLRSIFIYVQAEGRENAMLYFPA